ncbi:hypothetical protein [Lysinibacillus sphaericus]|uniref:Uncharacterized protein n=1 Tax=Lysinibacillus sphaericus OT4b.31 TaxID=1285586 RepID=R7ZA61_LYSSH|nr:hypothetical protein [Lysinibacillus sphaericus]EON70861.1 hypothetical protein H131_19337 [Lysinibacillus sphaericus OT4b.31]
MDLFIASNRQLPIRYYVNEAIWIRRGCCYLPQLTLPFFVEVEVKNTLNLQIITEYVLELQRQYKYTEIQILIRDTTMLVEMLENFPISLSSNHLLKIEKL